MKAIDLQIGDWVTSTRDKRPGIVVSIDTQTNRVILQCMDGCLSAHILEVNPILITPEILEKNGFDYMGNSHYDYEDGYGQLVGYDTFNRRLKIIRDLDIIFDSGDYAELMLHQLQHALRLCGIDKEITL